MPAAKKRPASFAARLREIRLSAGLTQAALAEKAGLHHMAVVKLEHGSREPAWATLLALAEALGVTLNDFVTPASGDEPPQPPAPRPRGRSRREQADPEGKGEGEKGKGE
jgi:transcriptional regulator with XRE-family HTH domain